MAKKDTKAKDKKDTKKFVEIDDIKDRSILLKDGSLRGVLEVGSMNFELKSQDEQTAIIQYFQSFLNALDFSLQIAIISRKLNIDNYLATLEQKKEIEENELMRIQTTDYIRFIKGLTELSNIMTKKFYVVVPYYIQELGLGKQGLMGSVKSIFSPSKTAKQLPPEKFNEYQSQLLQRVEVVASGLGALGLTPRLVEAKELKTIFQGLYNPGEKETV